MPSHLQPSLVTTSYNSLSLTIIGQPINVIEEAFPVGRGDREFLTSSGSVYFSTYAVPVS